MGETPTEIAPDEGALIRAVCTGCKEKAIHKFTGEQIPDNRIEIGKTLRSPCDTCGSNMHVNITELVALVDNPVLGFNSTRVIWQ